MRNYGNGVENRCGGGSRKAFGGDFMGLILITGMEMGTEERERTARNLRDTAVKRRLPLEGTEKGLYLPTKMLEDAGFSHVTKLDDLACTIEEGRILLELPDTVSPTGPLPINVAVIPFFGVSPNFFRSRKVSEMNSSMV